MPHTLTIPLIVAAALAVPAIPAIAQTQPQTGQPQTGTPSQPGTSGGTEGSSGAAAMVGTEQPTAEVQQHLHARGYSNMHLKPDDIRGGWSGTAMRNGKQVKLHVAPNGNASEH
jgi:hypothetical protein